MKGLDLIINYLLTLQLSTNGRLLLFAIGLVISFGLEAAISFFNVEVKPASSWSFNIAAYAIAGPFWIPGALLAGYGWLIMLIKFLFH